QLSQLTSSIGRSLSVTAHGLPALLLSELSISPRQRRLLGRQWEARLEELEKSFRQDSSPSHPRQSQSVSAARKASLLTVPTSQWQSLSPSRPMSISRRIVSTCLNDCGEVANESQLPQFPQWLQRSS